MYPVEIEPRLTNANAVVRYSEVPNYGKAYVP